MHNLLQEMGWEIVRLESVKFPGERSRFWFHEEVNDVLTTHGVTPNNHFTCITTVLTIKDTLSCVQTSVLPRKIVLFCEVVPFSFLQLFFLFSFVLSFIWTFYFHLMLFS